MAATDSSGVLICPYLATSCPLLKPFAASFANNNNDDGSNTSNGPSPSACASAHSSPQTHLPQNQNGSSTYNANEGPSVPIHSLHGPSSGYDGHGSGQAQYQQHQERRPIASSATSQGSYSNQQPSTSYPRPTLETQNSGYTGSSTSTGATSAANGGRTYGRPSQSPPRDYVNQQASSSYSNANDEPPTPNSFLRSPPLGPIAHLQQPVFPHHEPSNPSDSHRRPDPQRYDSSSSADPYGAYPSSSSYDQGQGYSNGAGPSTFANGSRGGYGSFGAEDIEDLSFHRSQPAQSFPGFGAADEERKVFATVQEVGESSHPPEEAVGEQTAFISKLWHLLTHPEYTRYLRWSKDGQAFILTNSNEFAIKVLPRFFRHSNVASFVRQLNLYSFQRVSTIRLLDMADSSTSTSINPSHHEPHTHTHQPFGPDSDSEDHHSSHSGGSPGPNGNADSSTVTASGFTHPHFQRDHPELLKLLKPRGSTRKSNASTVAAKKAAAVVRDEADRRGGAGGLKRAASSAAGSKGKK